MWIIIKIKLLFKSIFYINVESGGVQAWHKRGHEDNSIFFFWWDAENLIQENVEKLTCIRLNISKKIKYVSSLRDQK